ncbi:SURF1 family protein [Nocardioides sp. MAHUQ-72]|uniref:SURF1 family protein n=1 Tax=unclassified Nocardioides TaxID=2615069 RepID=UPI0036087B19
MPTLLAPRYWGAHLLALVLTAAAVGLGVWQYDAWQARRAAEATDLTLEDPVPLDSVIGPDDPFPGTKVGQPVILDGQWVPEGTVYVSGREQDGRDGYWVVTPLAVTGAQDPAIPVVRGWVDDWHDAPEAPTGRAEMVGWLQPTEGTGEVDDDPDDDVLPQLRTADVIQHVDQDLYGAYAVVADKAAPGSWPVGDRALNDGTAGLAPADLAQLPDAGRFTALRNLLYAIEWVFFGAFVVFVWWRWTQDVRREADTEPEPQDDPVPSEP